MIDLGKSRMGAQSSVAMEAHNRTKSAYAANVAAVTAGAGATVANAPARRGTNHLSAFGTDVDTFSRRKSEPRSKSDALDGLPEIVKRNASKASAEGLKLLAHIVRTSDETGRPVSFTSFEAGGIMGVDRHRAAEIVTHLERSGLIISRRDRFGAPAGYDVCLP